VNINTWASVLMWSNRSLLLLSFLVAQYDRLMNSKENPTIDCIGEMHSEDKEIQLVSINATAEIVRPGENWRTSRSSVL
jgi:hypothetical protein